MKAATANENPCKPVPVGEVYFNAAPATAFLEMNVGETITVEVDAFSDAPMGNWTILAQDGTDPTGATVYTSMSFSGGTTQDAGPGSALVTGVNNGSKPQLSITLTQDPSQVQNGEIGPGYGEADIYLWSYTGPDTNIANATAGHYWTMAVMTRADATDAGLTFLDGGVPEKHGGKVGMDARPGPRFVRRGVRPHPAGARVHALRRRGAHTLNRKCMTSPSRTTYSFPSIAELPGLAALRLAAELHEVLPPDDLGLDEALLEVGVDDARGLRGLRAPA